MNRIITRGLALAALTGGFTLLGATAAMAHDLDDDGGLLGTGISLGGSVPVTVDGLHVAVLPGHSVGSLGDGVLVHTGATTAELLAAAGLDTAHVLGSSQALTTFVGIPVDVSNTWVSILGKHTSGVAIVPNAHTQPTAVATDGEDGLVNGYLNVPVTISCTSVTLLSNYRSDCGEAGTGGGADDDGVKSPLGGDSKVVGNEHIKVLGGSGPGRYDGVVVDPVDDGPVSGADARNAWLSVLGDNGGVVLVPDSFVNPELLTLGLVDGDVLAPFGLDCLTVSALSDYERTCSGATGPTGPVEPVDPGDLGTLPGDGDNNGVNDGAADNGGTGGTDEGDNNEGDNECELGAAVATAATSTTTDVGMLGVAAVVGALTALGLLALARRLRVA